MITGGDLEKAIGFLTECLDVTTHAIPTYGSAVHCPDINQGVRQVYDEAALLVFWGNERTKLRDYWNTPITEAQKRREPAGRAMAVGLVDAFQKTILLAEESGAPPLFDVIEMLVYLQRLPFSGISDLKQFTDDAVVAEICDIRERLVAISERQYFKTMGLEPLIANSTDIETLVMSLTGYVDDYFQQKGALLRQAYGGTSDPVDKITQAIDWVRSPENAPYVLQAWRDLKLIRENISKPASELEGIIGEADRVLPSLLVGEELSPLQDFQLEWLKAHQVGITEEERRILNARAAGSSSAHGNPTVFTQQHRPQPPAESSEQARSNLAFSNDD